jgi:indole-3-glycerol phosphate synthase
LLEDLYAGSLADAARRQELVPTSRIEKLALSAAAPLDALTFLGNGEDMRVIAEIKRASPSKGHLAVIPDPAALAATYQQAGVSAISVLTEQRSFLGSLEDLDKVREVVAVPVLRKDFIANEYQILEARAHGADIVLLIAAGLKPDVILRLKRFTESLGMTAFIETHNEAEVGLASSIEAKLVGINARDLATFETDRDLFAKLVGDLPLDSIKVAESAVRGPEDVASYAQAGADCVLVGEALVTGDAHALIQAFSQISKA